MSSEEIQRYDELMARCERESAETLRLLDTMKEQVAECRRTVAETQKHITRVIDLMEMTARVSLANSQRIDAIEKRVPESRMEEKLRTDRRDGILFNPWTNPAPSPPINPASPNPDTPKLHALEGYAGNHII